MFIVISLHTSNNGTKDNRKPANLQHIGIQDENIGNRISESNASKYEEGIALEIYAKAQKANLNYSVAQFKEYVILIYICEQIGQASIHC